MNFTETDLDLFLENIYDKSFHNNNGGMGSPDMFSLYYALTQIKPDLVIESGVWNGLSTKLIRKTLGDDITIICIDPRNIPKNGFIDSNPKTIYLTGKKFIDFKKLNLNTFKANNIFAFFDDHQNSVERLIQSNKKNIKHIFYNDNYPKDCGSHYTINHLLSNDTRLGNYNKDQIEKLIDVYHIFPNIFPGKIKTGEGFFDCDHYFDSEKSSDDKYKIFSYDREKYRWNTYIKLH